LAWQDLPGPHQPEVERLAQVDQQVSPLRPSAAMVSYVPRSAKSILSRMQDDSPLREAVQPAATASTEATAQLAAEQCLQVSPEPLWHHLGTLASGGLPRWRG